MSFKFSFRPRYSSFIIPVLNIYFSRFRKCLYILEGWKEGVGWLMERRVVWAAGSGQGYFIVYFG